MPKSRADLVRRAWALLVRPSDGETPDAADLKIIDDLVDPIVAQLATSYVIQIGNPAEIDDAVFLPLSTYLANESAPEFSQSWSQVAKDMAAAGIREALDAAVYNTVRADYF